MFGSDTQQADIGFANHDFRVNIAVMYIQEVFDICSNLEKNPIISSGRIFFCYTYLGTRQASL